MHMAKQVQGKALGRVVNFVSEVLLRICTQPLDRMVG